ncbi:MAG: DbpA RNA binding domain-containing protein [Spirochaetota bacterium]
MERLIARHARHRRDLIAEAASHSDRVAAAALAAVARVKPNQAAMQSLVMTSTAESISTISNAITERLGSGSGVTLVSLRPDSDARREEGQVARGPAIVVSTPARLIDHIRRDNVDLSGITTVTVDVPPEGNIEQFSADLHFIYAKLDRRPTTFVLVSDLGRELDLLEDLLRRPVTAPDTSWASPTSRLSKPPSEERTMQDLPFDPEKLKERLREIVHAIHHDEDPEELNKYRAHARKHTSIFNRGYVLAYLLKGSMGGGGGRRPRSSRKAGTPGPAKDTDKQSIFVSIGRSKRVRSRDLVTFFTSAGAVSQDDIGQVKVLDNYSFVEISSDKAQAAIDELNGQELRGRKLTVNYARKK